MAKYSYEEKLEVVLRVGDEGMSRKASAKILGEVEMVVNGWAANNFSVFSTRDFIIS